MTILKTTIASAVLIASIAGAASTANATSFAVKMACASDYYSYCSQHPSGSSSAKQCMRKNGKKLSKRCVSALVKAGYVSTAYVASRRAR